MLSWREKNRPSSEDTSCEDNLLGHSTSDFEDPENVTVEDRSGHRGGLFRTFCTPWMFHFVAFSIYTLIYMFLVHISRGVSISDIISDEIYSPVAKFLEYESRTFHISINDTNEFNRKPGHEVDSAWHRLLANANMRFSGHELKKLNRSSVQLSDNSGDYMGTLSVYHQLHCLQYIRQVVHSDHYSFAKSNIEPVDHADHCIESLRQYLMCNSDVSVLTYDWLPDFKGPWPDFEVAHRCVNWEALDSWAGRRAFDLFEPGLLIHPTLGPLFETSEK